MIKKLLLVRHASSDYAELGLKDIDRTLNETGIQQAHSMANYVKDKGVCPDLLIVSPAVRTRKTALFFVDSFGIGENKINLVDDVYEAEPETLLEIIRNVSNEIETLMLVGHNPSIALLSSYLSNEIIEQVPTCGIVDLIFNLDDWAGISRGSGELISLQSPETVLSQGM
ncbi:MAG: histidine phosphatase family protein [Gammaproteobacteria bacterium]|nr:histidine phosphatase family protein [Gammaproteobacteria bacterium]